MEKEVSRIDVIYGLYLWGNAELYNLFFRLTRLFYCFILRKREFECGNSRLNKSAIKQRNTTLGRALLLRMGEILLWRLSRVVKSYIKVKISRGLKMLYCLAIEVEETWGHLRLNFRVALKLTFCQTLRKEFLTKFEEDIQIFSGSNPTKICNTDSSSFLQLLRLIFNRDLILIWPFTFSFT